MSKFDSLAQVVGRLIEEPEAHGHMGQLAQDLGLERSQFQRMFKEQMGITPARFRQFLMSRRALAHLRMDKSILAASLDAGFSSSSRLHDALITWEAMSPGMMRHGGTGQKITHGVTDSLLGPMMLAWTEIGLCFVGFVQTYDGSFHDLRTRHPHALHQRDDVTAKEFLHDMGFMTGQPCQCRMHLMGSNFQLQVWRALLQVRQGFWTSYGDLAEAMGKPKASRAIGGAVGANPLAVLVPCHRVMAADGRWNGYHWGLDIKKALIAIEAGDQSSDSTSLME